jgi:uncharacterized protein GlcG (DUF336 family)
MVARGGAGGAPQLGRPAYYAAHSIFESADRHMAELGLPDATTIVEASLRKGRETSCAPLAVAVLDAGGHLKAFAREDGAGIIRPQIAMGKAWGALGMGSAHGRWRAP